MKPIFPGIVLFQGFSGQDRFQAELIKGATALEGLASQVFVHLRWGPGWNPAGIVPHSNYLYVMTSHYHAIKALVSRLVCQSGMKPADRKNGGLRYPCLHSESDGRILFHGEDKVTVHLTPREVEKLLVATAAD